MRSDVAREIRRLSLFRDMADDRFEALIRAAYLQTFPPHVQLFEEGEDPAFLSVLIEGSVELFSEWSGRQTTMSVLGPVVTLVLAATIVDRPYLVSARTLEKSRIALIPSEDVRVALAEDPALAREIVAELAMAHRESLRQVKNLKLRSSVERLANYLLCQSAGASDRSEFQLPIEKRLLASALGMTPENLSRAFASLRRYGVVVNGTRVRLESQVDLRRLARPSDLIDRIDA
jgi:CRP/FNR family transcriptional regulator, transcriptional activator FtrB